MLTFYFLLSLNHALWRKYCFGVKSVCVSVIRSNQKRMCEDRFYSLCIETDKRAEFFVNTLKTFSIEENITNLTCNFQIVKLMFSILCGGSFVILLQDLTKKFERLEVVAIKISISAFQNNFSVFLVVIGFLQRTLFKYILHGMYVIYRITQNQSNTLLSVECYCCMCFITQIMKKSIFNILNMYHVEMQLEN